MENFDLDHPDRFPKDPNDKLKKPLLIVGGVLAAVGTAAQLAGVTTVLLAGVTLIVGVWIFLGAEIWFSDWLSRFGKYKNVVFCSFFCLVGCGVLMIDQALHDAKVKQDANSSSLSFVQAERINFRPPNDQLIAGQHLDLNGYAMQHGPVPVTRVIIDSLLLEKKVDPKGGTTANTMQTVNRFLDKLKSDYDSGKLGGTTLGVGQGIFGTTSLPELTQGDVDGIRLGAIRIYLVVWVSWTDSLGQYQNRTVCQWLQTPQSQDLNIPINMVWHPCDIAGNE